MSDDSSNPYQSPSDDAYRAAYESPESAPQSRESIDYMSSYTKLFEHPDWLNGLLLPSVALLIPLLGGLVVMGYEYENVARALTGRGERPYSLFTFDRFGDYLMRSVWLMLYGLCTSLVILPVVLLCAAIIGLFASLQNEALMAVGMVLAFAVYLIAIIFLNLVILPGMIRVALTKEISQGFDFAFIRDFTRKMWAEEILVFLFLAISSGIVANVGYMLCCVGILPAFVIISFATAQLMMQLYQVYVFRGGQPIEIAV